MEKRVSAYSLAEIQAQMKNVRGLRLTASARAGLVALDWDDEVAVEIIQGLDQQNFYKAMTCYADSRVWQDVYHASHESIELYIKFQRDEDGYFTISFKER